MSETDQKQKNDDVWSFLRLVQTMRRAQKAQKDRKSFEDAKRLEAAVDYKLSELGIK